MDNILINITPQETRVAVVENGAVQELHIERALERGLVGNIYLGKVSRVLPGMQSAFVDIGLERAAFLHASGIQAGGNNDNRADNITELVREGDEFWDFAGDRRFGYADIEGKFGVRPERMADYLALTGDSVDNIPGVPGVGPKTAAALLKVFESLDHLYDNLGEVAALPIRGAAKLPGRLREHREAAYLARRLTCIACDMPLEFVHDDLRRRAPDVPALESFYERARFGPMLGRQAQRLARAFGP